MIIENIGEKTLIVSMDSLMVNDSTEIVNLVAQNDDTIEFFEIADSKGEIQDWSQIGVITGVGYLVVFFVLALLILVFSNLPKLLAYHRKQKLKREGKLNSNSMAIHHSGEVNAAIATALMIYLNEQHDEESNVITIKRVTKVYSPWSSKIYGLNNYYRSR